MRYLYTVAKTKPSNMKGSDVDLQTAQRTVYRSKDQNLSAIEKLMRATWPDEELVLLCTEDRAAKAFKLSGPLQKEFGGEKRLARFLAYWRALRMGLINECK